MIDTTALRNKILLFALQGELTKSADTKDTENALFLRLKKHNPKVQEQSDSEDLPFEIPQNWKWVQLGDIFTHNTGKALNSSNGEGTELRYITTSNVYWDRFELDEIRTMFFKDDEIEKCTVTYGDLLVCEGGDIGRSAIWDKDFDVCIQNHLHRLRPEIEGICVKLYYYVLMYYKNSNMISGQGIGLQGLSSKRLHSIIVPLPSEDEQPLIVDKIDAVFSILASIDDLQTRYAADRDVLKGKLIDAAICGKLTNQLPEDGTAEDLYQQIQEEKKRLEKEGKIKKSKKLPEITEDEIPFDIPANWKWVRLSDVLDVRDGTHDSPKYHDEGIPLVTSKNISGGSLSFDDVKLISEDDAKKINERSFVDDGDILFAMIGSIGNPVIVKKDRDFCIKNVALFKNISEKDLDMSYVYWFLMHEQYELRKTAIGGLQPFVSLKVFRNHLMPLPPIAEQKRISNRLYELSAAVTEQSL